MEALRDEKGARQELLGSSEQGFGGGSESGPKIDRFQNPSLKALKLSLLDAKTIFTSSVASDLWIFDEGILVLSKHILL